MWIYYFGGNTYVDISENFIFSCCCTINEIFLWQNIILLGSWEKNKDLIYYAIHCSFILFEYHILPSCVSVLTVHSSTMRDVFRSFGDHPPAIQPPTVYRDIQNITSHVIHIAFSFLNKVKQFMFMERDQGQNSIRSHKVDIWYVMF